VQKRRPGRCGSGTGRPVKSAVPPTVRQHQHAVRHPVSAADLLADLLASLRYGTRRLHRARAGVAIASVTYRYARRRAGKARGCGVPSELPSPFRALSLPSTAPLSHSPPGSRLKQPASVMQAEQAAGVTTAAPSAAPVNYVVAQPAYVRKPRNHVTITITITITIISDTTVAITIASHHHHHHDRGHGQLSMPTHRLPTFLLLLFAFCLPPPTRTHPHTRTRTHAHTHTPS
jgi:hypothetical protein